MDPRNCECKFCAPPDAQRAFEEMTQYQVRRFGIKVPDEKPIKISQQVGTKIENQQSLVPPRESNSITNTSKASDQSKDIPRLLTTSSPQMTKQQLQEANQVQKQTQPQRRTSITATTSQRPAIAPNQKPTPPVPHLNPDQKLDFMPQKFMFRQGEAIWFARDDGQGPFGLGVVVYREMVPKSPGLEKPRYKVQPLSHPFSHPEAEIIREEVWLKPWLAFSPPDPFHESLRNIDTPYYRLPWKDILEGKWGVGDAEVDGSIFAARTVDGTYTVFEPLPIKEMGKSYNGVFFGGEKVWRGEAVRLAGASREGQILIISDILEVTPAPGQPAELIFVGDVYVWKRLRPEDKSPPPNNFLPQLVNLDLNFRNEVARAAKKSIHIWHFIESRARFSWEDLKGRWYPSRYLVPSLCGSEEFQQQITLGDVIDAGSKINSQGDYAPSEGGIKVISKKDTRAAAFGGSIPSGKLDFGISQKQYTTIIGASVPSANTKSVNMNTQLGAAPRPSYTPKQQSQAQALHQQFQHLTPLQRQQLEQQQVQARQALQQQQAHHQRTPMRQAIDTVMPDARAPSNEDPMDMDFHQFIN